jgi:signal recognition particle subunit SRP54
MASRILGMGDVLSLIEKAEETVDREAAQQVERNLRQGQLTFDDFLVQIQQLRKMGLQSVIDMLPGGNQILSQTPGDPEKDMRRSEAIILSMTPAERSRPEIINGRRRRRIAAGSGTQVSDVNQLLRAREQMQQLARQLGMGNFPAGGKRRGMLGGLGNLFRTG